MSQTPVITVDGPSGSGKGTICAMLAKELGWHLLDSGALYRITGTTDLFRAYGAGNVITFQHHTDALLARYKLNIQICCYGRHS